LTDSEPGDPPRDRRSNRRSFADEEKLTIMMEAEQPDVSVAAVCRHHEIATSMVFRWRIQFGFGPDERRSGDGTMMIVPAGVKVHLALGYTDLRKGTAERPRADENRHNSRSGARQKVFRVAFHQRASAGVPM
jgi:transposase-like protein